MIAILLVMAILLGLSCSPDNNREEDVTDNRNPADFWEQKNSDQPSCQIGNPCDY